MACAALGWSRSLRVSRSRRTGKRVSLAASEGLRQLGRGSCWGPCPVTAAALRSFSAACQQKGEGFTGPVSRASRGASAGYPSAGRFTAIALGVCAVGSALGIPLQARSEQEKAWAATSWQGAEGAGGPRYMLWR